MMPAGPVGRDAVPVDEVGEEENGMGVAEQQVRPRAVEVGDESADRLRRHAQRVEVDGPIV